MNTRREALTQRREQLTESSNDRRRRLEASYSYQLFERDSDEIKVWISEKQKIANDANYKEPTNLQGIANIVLVNYVQVILLSLCIIATGPSISLQASRLNMRHSLLKLLLMNPESRRTKKQPMSSQIMITTSLT